MRLSELKQAGRSPNLPLTIELADAAGPGQLQLLSLLRVLPGQRYVGARCLARSRGVGQVVGGQQGGAAFSA